MIKIEKSKNFKGWMNIFVCGFHLRTVTNRAKALKIAKKLAKTRNEESFSFLGFPINSNEK
jgi:hypothetical protein